VPLPCSLTATAKRGGGTAVVRRARQPFDGMRMRTPCRGRPGAHRPRRYGKGDDGAGARWFQGFAAEDSCQFDLHGVRLREAVRQHYYYINPSGNALAKIIARFIHRF